MNKQPLKVGYGLGRVAFKAHLAEIKQEIEAGYTMLLVYEKRKDSLGISYSQFARHVQRYIRNESPAKRSIEPIEESAPVKTINTKKAPRKPFASGFDFNPVAPDYGDLI